jgi:hypothetical protein
MMGKPAWPDRIAQGLIALAALISLGNGLFMLADPNGWYNAVPTVKFTGPPNGHFIRDIGIAYLVCAILLGFAAINPPMRWLALVAGGLWLSGHGALHVWEVASGICAPEIFWQDAPGVLGPPLLVWIALGILLTRQRIAPAGLPDRLMLAGVDRLSPGESEYFHELAAAPGAAFERIKHFMPVTMHRHDAPADLFHMARIGATLVEDCGPCALTAAQGALADGLDRDCRAFDFGQAIARQSADAFALGDAIEASHGRTTRLELAMTAATVRSYPAMKRGLGLSKTCSATRLEV